MYEILINPITLICLGIVFIFTSLLFFYFKRTFSLLEKTQMDQARVLQGFITNMEMGQQLAMQRQQHQSQVGSGINYNDSNELNESNDPNDPQISASQKLISISDDDSDDDSESDADSDSDSDDIDETENDDNIVIDSKIDFDSEIIELQNIDNIKVIQLQNNNLEEVNPMIIEIASLEEVNDITINKYENDFDDSDEDDDSDDSDNSDDSDDSNQDKEDKIENPSPTITDFKTLNVQTIRQMASDSGLIKAGEKKNKKELIKLLEEAKK